MNKWIFALLGYTFFRLPGAALGFFIGSFFKSGVSKISNKDFEITTSWFTQVEPTKSSEFHNHTNCFISGVLYLQTTPNSGDIIFQEFGNKAFNLLPSEFNLYNSKEWIYKPQNGLLLL